jgi:NADH-quinone oxidoreductase subunit G
MAEDIVTIVVNGTPVAARRGQRLLDLLAELGIDVPTLCFDRRLPPHGACRVCLVARRDRGAGLVTACSTEVEREMVIDTATPDVIAARRRQLELLAFAHRMECPTCEESGVCQLQRYLFEYGVDGSLGPAPVRPRSRHVLAPFLLHDSAKCILCQRCVRVCEELVGVAALGVMGRGAEAHIDGFGGVAAGCDLCGACVEACPVGALTGNENGGRAPHWMRDVDNSICTLCSLACRTRVERFGGRSCAVRPAPAEDGPGVLCARGWLGQDAVDAESRLTSPLIRENDEWCEASWDDALRRVADAMRDARERGKTVVGVASPRLLNEDAYLFQRLLRATIGTPHVLLAPTRTVEVLEVLEAVLGSPPALAGERELAAADAVLVAGEDPSLTHPVAKSFLLAAARRGARLVYLPWRSGPVGRRAAVRVSAAPGRQAEVVGLIARWKTVDNANLPKTPVPAQAEAMATGARATDLAAARSVLEGAHRPLVVLSLSRCSTEDPVALTKALLVLLANLSPTVEVGRQFLLLGDGVNTLGALAMGLHPGRLPGWRSVQETEDREACSRVWGRNIPAERGYDWAALRRALAQDQVGVLYLVGADPTLVAGDSLPPALVQRAGLVVAQAGHTTPATRSDDVVLPVAVLNERHGHLLRFDGSLARLQRSPAAPPLVRQDGEIFVELGRLLASSLPAGRALRAELAALGPKSAGAPGRVSPVARPPQAVETNELRLYWGPVPGHDGWTTSASRRLAAVWPHSVIWLASEDYERVEASFEEPIVVELDGSSHLLQPRLDPDLRPGCAVADPFGFALASGGWCEIPPSGRPIVIHPVRGSLGREHRGDRQGQPPSLGG